MQGSNEGGAAVPAARPGSRVAVIVSASLGAGHDGAAAELARRLEAAGVRVEHRDLMRLLPLRTGTLITRCYRGLLVRAPGVYQHIYVRTERAGGDGAAARLLLRASRRRVLRSLPADTGVVVSTYPGASRVLGMLRREGRLGVPAVTYLTDLSVHPLWVSPGVDLHLAAHPVTAGQARRLGARTVVSGPVVDPRFRAARDGERAAARAGFGLPEHAPLALLVAGSWGVGPIRRVAAEIRDAGTAVPVVVCGRNADLAARLRADGFAHVHGWVDDMPALMRACDVLVQNAGGLTSLEACAAGLPVATYACIPGHGPANAAALDRAGLAPWIRDARDLGRTIGELINGQRGSRQRQLGLDLFRRDPERGPAAEILRALGTGGPAAAHPTVPALVRAVRGAGSGPGGRRGRTRGIRRATVGLALAAAWLAAVPLDPAVPFGHGMAVLHTIEKHVDPDTAQARGVRGVRG